MDWKLQYFCELTNLAHDPIDFFLELLIYQASWLLPAIVVIALLYLYLPPKFTLGGKNARLLLGYGAVAYFLVVGSYSTITHLQNQDIHHPQHFVGHSYELGYTVIRAAPTEQGIWDYTMADRKRGFVVDTIHPLWENCGMVYLTDSDFKATWWEYLLVELGIRPRKIRLFVFDTAREKTECPLLHVRVENNTFKNLGTTWWIPAEDLTWRDCAKVN